MLPGLVRALWREGGAVLLCGYHDCSSCSCIPDAITLCSRHTVCLARSGKHLSVILKFRVQKPRILLTAQLHGESATPSEVHTIERTMRKLQVGKDQEAQAFLGKLDNDPVIGPMVDATSYFELEAEEYRKKGVVLTPGKRGQSHPLPRSTDPALDPLC